MPIQTIKGDLLALAQAGEFDVIAHGCNCHRVMGGGIAFAISRTWPEVLDADCATLQGDRAKLGTCTEAVVEGGRLTVVNAYTQYDHAGLGPLVDYGAVRSCMAWIGKHHAGKRIGLPKIGAGLAGGDWARIEAIISRELAGEDVTIVVFSG